MTGLMMDYPPCAGFVLHTLNLRLAPAQLAYIINHAEDRVIFVDASLRPVLELIQSELKSVTRIIVLDDFMSEPILQLIPMFRANGWGIPCFSFANLCPTGGQ